MRMRKPLVALVSTLSAAAAQPSTAAGFEVKDRAALVILDDGALRLRNDIYRIEGIRLPRARQGDCGRERARGQAARKRLEDMLATGTIRIEPTGSLSRAGYQVARVMIGRENLAQRLLDEGLATEKSAARGKNPWCGG